MGGGQKCKAVTAQEQPSGATLCQTEVRGGGRMCKTGTVQKLPRGGTSRPRPGVVAKISNPTPKEQWLHRLRRVQRNYSTCKVRKEA